MDPCSLQHAVSSASSGDQIWVQTGNYTVATGNEVLFIDKSLLIIGGCVSDFSTCLPNTIPSTNLDGQNSRRVVTIQGTMDVSVTMKNLTFNNGNATNVDTVSCPNDLNPVIPTSGCGGGLFGSTLLNLTIDNCRFTNNNATLAASGVGYGGAILIDDTNFINFSNNLISNNTASVNGLGYGGGLYVHNNMITSIFDHNTFDQNDCTMVNSSSMGCHAMFYDNELINFKNNALTNGNSQPTLNIDGSAINFSDNSKFYLSNNTFEGQQGGSVISGAHTSVSFFSYVQRNKFWDNYVLDVVRLSGQLPAEISNNFIGFSASGTRLDSNRGALRTAISLTTTSRTNIYFNSIAKINRGVYANSDPDIYVKNNIFAFLTNEAITSTGTKIIDSNLFYQFVGGFTGTNAIINTVNPQFIDATSGNFHLQPGSGAIDQAIEGLSILVDVDGDTRPIGIPDLGADEWSIKNYLSIIFR
ncbi:MAG: hypothetical protein MUO40_09615 [Anaerolineaceae bacterium]|nr:hypothetical protein [Anaerolineaceae bacterium]